MLLESWLLLACTRDRFSAISSHTTVEEFPNGHCKMADDDEAPAGESILEDDDSKEHVGCWDNALQSLGSEPSEQKTATISNARIWHGRIAPVAFPLLLHTAVTGVLAGIARGAGWTRLCGWILYFHQVPPSRK